MADKAPASTLANSISAIDVAHHFHPFANMRDLIEGGVRVITRGEGVHIYDDQDRRYLDAFAGLWCVNVGYGRREIIDAVHAQMSKLVYYNMFFGTTTEPTARLAEKICHHAGPGMNHVFFTNSGSEAHDTWLRMASVYWTARGQPERRIVIARNNAYHGSTVAAASLGGMKNMHEQGNLPIPGIVHIGQPYWYAEGEDLSPDEFGLLRARELEAAILEAGPEKVAAFVAEPIQGAGGIIIPPDSYWPEIDRICKHYGILLVTDEVICGFGRLGSWFGFQHYGVTPDICTIAKGLSSGYLPIAGVILHDRVADVLIHETDGFDHGFTYSGHPVAAAAALANLDIIENERLVERVRDEIGPYFKTAWASLADHPMVGEAVSVGLLGALQIALDKTTRQRFSDPSGIGSVIRNFCLQNGLIVRATADRILVSPALIINSEQVDEIIRTIRDVLDFVYKELT